MIRLTRLNHQSIAVNSELIKWIESSPDTVISLVTGEKLVVLETCDEVIASILALHRQLRSPYFTDQVAPLPTSAEFSGGE